MQEDIKLGIPDMDAIHEGFTVLLSRIQKCEPETFMPLYEELIAHTRDHFAFEESLMAQYRFYDSHEHLEEHTKLLDEMVYFYEKSKKFPVFGRSYINDYAYDKFKRHVVNIDSQLAMFLKEQQISRETVHDALQ
ncbi:MAG TPA: hemerythrin [Campylobacteraceae bacterium]|nr:hemerythrin [Campylobacteraceae bacterium]